MLVPSDIRKRVASKFANKPAGILFPCITMDIIKGECPDCHKPVEAALLLDELVMAEYLISGLCALCQDHVFSTWVDGGEEE